MDVRERAGDLVESLRMGLDGRQARMWTATPGIIQSFDAVAMTCVVQPSIMSRVSAKDGTVTDLALPLLLDCPVQFPSGGGVTLTFPLAQGDECLVVFASRCIDSWWQSGGVQTQAEARMHDLSDGFVLAGVRSQPRVITNISTTAAQLRTDDGAAYIELDPAGHVAKIKASNIILDGPVHITGITTADADVNITGTATASVDVVGGGKHLKTHTHGGVTVGGGTTGAPS